MPTYKVLLFYRFLSLTELIKLSEQIKNKCNQRNLIGRILLAPEGINGTLAGYGDACDEIIKDFVELDNRFQFVDWKITMGTGDGEILPFPDLYIKIVKELIGTGLLGKDIFDKQMFSNDTYGGLEKKLTGVHLTPKEWHEALSSECHREKNNINNDNLNSNRLEASYHADLSNQSNNLLVLDVRNDIEYQVGHFKGSTNLKTVTYSESWKSIDNILANNQCDKDGNSKIFMYCTGGIRCEKASAYLIKHGIDRERIFQLEGGIHRYLEQYPDGGMFQGKNYVFDQRVLTAPTEYQHTQNNNNTMNLQTEFININNFNQKHINSISNTQSHNQTCDTHDKIVLPIEKDISNSITAKCSYCYIPYDTVRKDRICCVCRHDVICCDDCVKEKNLPGEYHCWGHWHLRNCYHTTLENFTLEELLQQKKELFNILNDSLMSLGHKGKNKRRTIRNQIHKIEKTINNYPYF